MNRRSLLPLLSVVPLLVAAGDEPTWSEYRSVDGTCKVLLPGKPEMQTLERAEGHLKVYLASAAAPGFVFMIGSHEVPAAERRRPGAYLKEMEQGFLEVAHARLIDSREIILGDTPGRECTAEGFHGKWVRSQSYFRGKHAFQLSVLADNADGLQSKEARQFFSSFQILALSPAPPREEKNPSHELGRMIGRTIGIGAFVLVVVLVLWARRGSRAS